MSKFFAALAALLLACLPAAAVPTQPVVNDDGTVTSQAHRLHATWSATDPAGTISYYEYAVGYAAYPAPGWDAATLGWRKVGNVTGITASDITLSHTRTYYFAVRATNTSGQTGPVGVSDGIHLQLPAARTFTSTSDFSLGEMVSISTEQPDQLQLGAVSQTEPYIWIANHTIGRVTKIDTRTGVILAQYYSTRPSPSVLPDNLSGQVAIPAQGSNLQSPSRTAVDLDGNVYVANRAHVSGGQQGSVTKIAGSRAYAIDRNGNGRTDTSTGEGDVFAEDECVLWTAKVGKPGMIPRGVAVDAANNVWVSTYTDAVIYQFNGETGELMQSIDLKAETGNTAIQIYGLAIGRDGAIYGTSIDSKWATRTDPTAPAGSRVEAVQTFFSGYGIAVGGSGVQWIGRWEPGGETALQSIDWRQDPPLVSYHPNPYSGRTRGVAVDGQGNIWVAHYDAGRLLKFSPGGIFSTSYPVTSGPIGVAVDSDGMIWAVGGSSNTCTRINPTNGDRADFTAGGEPYSYSDMTGFQLRNFTARQGYWQVICDSGSLLASWPGVAYNIEQPENTLVKVEVRAADTTTGLESTPWTQAQSGVPLQDVTGRFLDVRVTFRVVSGEQSPVLYDLTVADPIPGPTLGDATIADAKAVIEGALISLPAKRVTYTGTDFFYIEEPLRNAGIRVESSDPVLLNETVTVVGNASTVASERRIVNAVVTSAAPGDPLQPVYTNAVNVGGSQFGWQPGTFLETCGLQGLRLWLRADTAADYLGAGKVTAWPDSCGSGVTLSQSDVNSQPAFVPNALNGQPVLRFDGNDFLVRSGLLGSAITSPDSATVYVVKKQSGTDTRNSCVGWGDNTNRLLIHSTYDGWLAFQHGDPNNGGSTGVRNLPDWADDYHILEAWRGGLESALVVDGATVASGTMTDTVDTAASQPLYIGSDPWRNDMTGDIAEVLVFDTALSETERLIVSNYLAQKYGLPYNPPDPSSPVLAASTQLSNVGLLVKVSGVVADEDSAYIYINDGSLTRGNLRVQRNSVASGVATGDSVQITGVCSVVEIGPYICPVLIPRTLDSAYGGDDFGSPLLSPCWTMIRPDAAYWSLTSNPGYLRLDTSGTDLWQNTNNLKNLTLRPIPDGDWSMETIVEGDPTQNYMQGGILVYQDDNNYLRFMFAYSGRREVSSVREVAGSTSGHSTAVPADIQAVQLRIDKTGRTYTLYWKFPSQPEWTKLADYPDLTFTNLRGGLFSLKGSGIGSPYIPFLFDYFRWSTL